jgi:hypothetical protein
MREAAQVFQNLPQGFSDSPVSRSDFPLNTLDL